MLFFVTSVIKTTNFLNNSNVCIGSIVMVTYSNGMLYSNMVIGMLDNA